MPAGRKAPLLLLVLALAACTGHPPPPSLAGSQWRPVEFAGAAPASGAELFVTFGGNGELRGSGGCNGFFGTYENERGALEISPLGATRMMCDEAVMADELAFLDVLGRTAGYVRDRKDLVLLDAGGVTLARLVQTDAD